jgi:hypothetical protein
MLSGNDVYYTSATATATGGAWNGVYLYGGNDIYYENHVLMTYNDIFYGGDGVDTAVFLGKASNYKIQAGMVWDTLKKVSNLPGFIISDNTKATNTLQVNQVERLQFTDKNIALDIGKDQAAGQAYMLYKAAFNRPADEPGLGFWVTGLDNGAKLVDVAKGFIDTLEFVKLYGNDVSNTTFVSNLYNVVLHRPLDQSGADFWVKALDNGVQRANLLIDFATSNENVAQVASLIANGIPYVPA